MNVFRSIILSCYLEANVSRFSCSLRRSNEADFHCEGGFMCGAEPSDRYIFSDNYGFLGFLLVEICLAQLAEVLPRFVFCRISRNKMQRGSEEAAFCVG